MYVNSFIDIFCSICGVLWGTQLDNDNNDKHNNLNNTFATGVTVLEGTKGR